MIRSGRSDSGRAARAVFDCDNDVVEFVTRADRPDLDSGVAEAFRAEWPEFVFHDQVAARHIDRVGRYFRDFDVLLLEDGRVVAGGWGVPLPWNGVLDDLAEGYDGALIRSIESYERGHSADCLSVMAAAVRADRRGRGLAGQVLVELRRRAAATGLSRVIAPVRPTLKARYPLTPMADFVRWNRADGLHIDPWIRTHQRLGATILCVARRSMVVDGTIVEWERWADMALPQSGRYIVPGALDVLEVSSEDDRASYVEANVWMRHV